MHIERVDPLDLDLDTADALAAVDRASIKAANLAIPAPIGPTRLTTLQLGSDCRPVDALWLAYEGGDLVGHAAVELPWRDNTSSASIRGTVHPEVRRRGLGRDLMERACELAHAAGRTQVRTGAWRGSDGEAALPALGFSSEGIGTNAVRRIDVHGTPTATWDRVYDEAAVPAADYELVHLVGPTPEDLLEDMVTLHAAINDAPMDDADSEADTWDTDRVRSYDRAMAGRRQTVYRVLARHRHTGEWAGISMLCVDEFLPTIAFQEDTSVVRSHRGHRLGLLMKADMLRWISQERPEVGATDTWNATTNHHMIAVNERLGATVIGMHQGFRLKD
ncbi:MAG TPA: GNAT family N-acetyltransferase [Nocardioidaceae bacterium]|nr:GNAT family N-acetyltransferase [Nocardioidaceae bacterium]